MDFSLNEALKYSKNWKINEWFQAFLSWVWWNKKLAEIIDSSWYLEELKIMKFEWLERVMWHDKENLKWSESLETWNSRISKIEQIIEKWWECPPLLIWYVDWKYTIADWNHRFEALKKLWKDEYWASIWYKDWNCPKS